MPDLADADIIASLAPLPPAEFSVDHARHLLWRAGFGGTHAQVRTLADWGLEKSVDVLLDFGAGARSAPFEPAGERDFDPDIMRPLTQEERREFQRAQRAQDEDTLARFRQERQRREQDDRQQMASVQRWWLRRMIETRHPLQEKLTLFWHGHFATSYRTIENSYHMFRQNQLFRRHAAGSFAELLGAIIQDPAMLAYLDNNDSRKDRPNENLAREVMELFALGIGNYSEEDIKEGARALTGYTFDDDEFRFNQRNHDTGKKTILGETGNWDGADFVRIILSQRACARFVTRRLYSFFVSDVPTDERGGASGLPAPQREALASLSDTLYSSNYDLRPVLTRLFRSRHFYSPAFQRQQIKSPVQLVVGAVRGLGTPVRDLAVLSEACDLMGQRIFFPPSVKGWVGGRTWINTSTYFVRQNILAYLLTGKKPVGYDANADRDAFDPAPLLAGMDGSSTDPDSVVRHLLRVTLGNVPSEGRAALQAYLASRENRINQETLTHMLLLISAMPEYQLC